MSILCELFGHKSIGNHFHYGKATPTGFDGIGREHWRVYVECQRCEERFYVCNLHGPMTQRVTEQPGNNKGNGNG